MVKAPQEAYKLPNHIAPAPFNTPGIFHRKM